MQRRRLGPAKVSGDRTNVMAVTCMGAKAEVAEQLSKTNTASIYTSTYIL